MGIPKMFRFLSERYPLILQRLDEDHVFDHFYLDMNGIIHQCTHPNDTEIAIEDIDEMFSRIFLYTERLFRIVSPTKLMFLAVDGVAPRAKMNQQRSRRFRSAKDAERNLADAIATGIDLPEGTPFDSNCITPGTQFMHDLSNRFRAWIHSKMSTDPAWQQGCTVVFSGAEVPGEGEHKIMDYIRKWRSSSEYSPNIRHCMYGLDADLMMLGLVAHAPHFTLIREKMRFNRSGRKVPVMRGTVKDAEEFELLEIAMLRDMLFLEFKRGDEVDPLSRPTKQSKQSMSKMEYKSFLANLAADKAESESSSDSESSGDEQEPKKKAPNFRYNSRRIVDDFVFMCILVGNDFLPNIPHLDISDGAINIMFRIYKRMLPRWGGYLTDRHRIHPDRLESFLAKVALTEADYFNHRAYTDGVMEYKTAAYRKQYYHLKCNFDPDGPDGERKIIYLRRIYMEGLHWVLQYYHNGVSSWNWFYPNFYAALASDMKNLRSLKITFQKGKPFKPLTQLMAVLPPESANFLPKPMRNLMIDPNSPVSDFYPLDFDTDLNGKRQPWEAVVVVPFIDEKRLLKEVNKIDKEKELTKEELERDQLGPENWFHAEKYPKAPARVAPVRPSKFFIPHSSRSRSPSPARSSPDSDGYFSRSSSPSRFRRNRSTSSSPNRSREQSPRQTGPERSDKRPSLKPRHRQASGSPRPSSRSQLDAREGRAPNSSANARPSENGASRGGDTKSSGTSRGESSRSPKRRSTPPGGDTGGVSDKNA